MNAIAIGFIDANPNGYAFPKVLTRFHGGTPPY
jgi:hypothetical protein